MTTPAYRSRGSRRSRRNRRASIPTVDAVANVDDCYIQSTCGHTLPTGATFYVHRTPAAWHYDPGFTGGTSALSPRVDDIEVLCVDCHGLRIIDQIAHKLV